MRHRVLFSLAPVDDQASDWPEEYLDGVAGVISCVGSFGGHDFMRKVCGEANVRVFDEAKRRGVARAVFISAHDYGPPLRDLLKKNGVSPEGLEKVRFVSSLKFV